MKRVLLLITVVVASCSKGAEADLPYIGEARSLAAEWALVNEQAAKGHLTAAYVQTMHDSIREQLQTVAKSLGQPKSAYAQEIAALTREPDNAAPAELRAQASKLKQIETSLESA